MANKDPKLFALALAKECMDKAAGFRPGTDTTRAQWLDIAGALAEVATRFDTDNQEG